MSSTDTNQASEDEQINDVLTNAIDYYISGNGVQPEAISRVKSLIRTEKLKLLDELYKSMPTVEQLTTKYGYYMPEKQYGYKLAVHDIREVLTKKEAEL